MADVTDAQQVAADLAEYLAHAEKHPAQWLPVIPDDAESLVAGYEVLPHVQRFADKVMVATGVRTIGTYPGHSPSIDRALDLFTPVNSTALGNAICEFFIANLARFGGRYAIYRGPEQGIWHRLDPVWRPMVPRGYPTQDHYDHVHLSFETTAAEPGPEPEPEGDPMALTFRYIHEGEDWVFDGPSALYFQCNDTRQITEVLDKLDVPALGKVSDTTHERYSDLAKAAGFAG